MITTITGFTQSRLNFDLSTSWGLDDLYNYWVSAEFKGVLSDSELQDAIQKMAIVDVVSVYAE